MGFTNKYPYVDFHELNADALIAKVDGYSARLTSAEGSISTLQGEVETPTTGLLDRVTAAESDIDTLEADVNTPSTGLLDRMTAAEGYISTLQGEVETPTTGLLDRVTALENAPAPTSNAVYYLEFDSSLVLIDPTNAYDSRIEYDWLKQFVPLNTSGEDTHVIKLYDSHTQKVYDLESFHLQESVSPDGKFIFTNREEHTTGGVVDYYVNSTVTVLQNGTNPTFAEENETLLPAVTSADAGDVLTVDNNGDWVAAAPDGGIFKISLQGPPPSPTGVNKTHAEILDALNHGLLPVIIDHTIGRTYYFDSVSQPLANSPIYFKCISITTSAIHNFRISLTSTNVFTLTDIVYAP